MLDVFFMECETHTFAIHRSSMRCLFKSFLTGVSMFPLSYKNLPYILGILYKMCFANSTTVWLVFNFLNSIFQRKYLNFIRASSLAVSWLVLIFLCPIYEIYAKFKFIENFFCLLGNFCRISVFVSRSAVHFNFFCI